MNEYVKCRRCHEKVQIGTKHQCPGQSDSTAGADNDLFEVITDFVESSPERHPDYDGYSDSGGDGGDGGGD